MKRIIQLGIALLIGNTLYGHEYEHAMAIDRLMNQLASMQEEIPMDLELHILGTNTPTINDLEIQRAIRKPRFLESLKKFFRIFMIIINNQAVQSKLKILGVMVANLIQVSIQAVQANQTVQAAQATTTTTQSNDPIDGIQPIPESGTTTKKTLLSTSGQQDQTTQVVLTNFAVIASHFINILRDPENSENVTPNLIGMLGGIVTIGTEVVKRGQFDANEQEISEFIHQLDPNFTQDLVDTIQETVRLRSNN
jgi:hypothetical protein